MSEEQKVIDEYFKFGLLRRAVRVYQDIEVALKAKEAMAIENKQLRKVALQALNQSYDSRSVKAMGRAATRRPEHFVLTDEEATMPSADLIATLCLLGGCSKKMDEEIFALAQDHSWKPWRVYQEIQERKYRAPSPSKKVVSGTGKVKRVGAQLSAEFEPAEPEATIDPEEEYDVRVFRK